MWKEFIKNSLWVMFSLIGTFALFLFVPQLQDAVCPLFDHTPLGFDGVQRCYEFFFLELFQ